MSDLSLLDLDSPKNLLNNERKISSVVSSWGGSNASDKDEVPVHLFLSPTHSDSAHSSGSNLKALEEQKREKNTEETSFSFIKERKLKVSTYPDVDADIVLSSPSHSQEHNSSESEDSLPSKSKNLSDSSIKTKSKFRTNKVHNFTAKVHKWKNEGNEIDNKLKVTGINKKDEHIDLSDPFNSSTDNEARKSVTPASDLSYRERIRGRFNAMKEKAVESLSRPQSRAQSKTKLKTLTVKQGGGGQRIENLLKLEENEITQALERHEKIKKRWKEAYKASLEKEHKSDEEYNDFFCDNKKSHSRITSSEEDSKSLSNFETIKNDQTNSKVLTSEFLGFKDDWDLTEFVEPKACDPKNIKLWEETLFYPSSRSVSIENKLEPGLNPRYVEDEGIFVEKKINVPKRFKNKLEQRLLKTPEGRKWFGRDGELISSSCPLKSTPSHSYFDDDTSKVFDQLVWTEPTISNLNYRYMDLSGNTKCVLDIDIHSVEFSHHPLFSREHVLAQRFKELFIKYQKRKQINNLNRLNGRLNALRRTRDNLKNILLAGGDNLDISNRLERYKSDIKEVRKMRYLEGQIDKQLGNKIIMTWKDLVKLREYQGYQTTSIKLNIKENSIIDLEAEKAKWTSDIKKDVKEVLEELNFEYKKKFEEYTQQHELWSQKKRKKKIKKEEEDSDTAEENYSSEDEDFLDEEPQPPKPIVSSEIKAEITEIYKESFRCPGEPELEFTLGTDTKMEGTAYNNKEELRRNAVKRCQIFVKLFYNGKEVCRTESQALNQKFSVTISQRFAVRILEWPESLMLEIYEETGTFNKNLLVPEIYLPFPDSYTTVESSEVVKYEFSSKINATFNHSGVGSGCKIIPCPDGSELNNKPLYLFTSGTVACRLGWVYDQENILAPPEKYWNFIKDDATTNLSEILLSEGSLDMEKLKEWAQKSKLDPHDPCNSAFFYFLENNEEIEKSKVSYFRLNPLMDEFDFCKKEDIDNNIRLKLLFLRDKGEPEFADFKMVPLNEKEIHKDIFKEYEKRQSTPDSLTDVLSSDPLDGHRLWGQKYLEQVQQRLLQQYRMTKRTKRYHDIIIEDNVPDIGTLGLTFMKGLRPKRPLHPERKTRKKITPQNLIGQEIKIIVNVVRAFEVPVRKDIDGMSTENSIDGFSLVNVRPFVEISFQGITVRTISAEGANPTWNQDLQIPLKNTSEYLPGGPFQSMKDTIYLHLFDERVIDLVEDESIRETNIHQRLEKHWLASMEIPFFTLYFNSRIEGTFKLYSPPVLLGYEREAHRLNVMSSIGPNPKLPQRDATYITLFVTVQPALNPPKPIQEKMECIEPLVLEKHLENWQKEIMTTFPHRKIKTLVLDITGKSVCVTKFVKPLPLPPIVEEKNENTTPEMLARFVAMIPLVAEGTIFSGFFDFWLTADQIHRFLSGDSEDHAILLCCYFLELGLHSYVLLGSGIPHGSTAYVFVKEVLNKKDEYFVWDATNGQKYNIDDSFCPLQKIYCLINDQNIWANIQTEESPRRTRFDFSKRADWFPAFGKNISAPTVSVQPQNLEYKLTSKQAVDILQDKLEKKLKDSIMKWRSKSRTQWNRYCSATLRKLLPDLEQSSWNIEKQTPDHIIQLQHILASHKVCGFPINMAYTNIETVIQAVKATGVHCKEGEKVEFALAAYIHPYPNDILSVWVYVASLVRRR